MLQVTIFQDYVPTEVVEILFCIVSSVKETLIAPSLPPFPPSNYPVREGLMLFTKLGTLGDSLTLP